MRTSTFAAVFLFAAVCCAQQSPLADRVLILVNDRMPRESGTGTAGASLFVGQYYAAKRNIPASNIFHLKTATDEAISMEDYKAEIEGPLRRFLDANGGAMRKKILYIVPTYGVPVRISQTLAVDSVIAVMYAGREDSKPPLQSPYAAPVGSRPPRFDVWSRQREAASVWKMFLVTRLDGPTALIAKGLVDKAMAAESSLAANSGVAYFDTQGTRAPQEWQYAIDNEIKAASELSKSKGFSTVLNVQRDALCGSCIPPATQYYYDPAAKNVVVDSMGSTASVSLSIPPLAEGDFTVHLREGNPQNTGNTVSVTLGGASDKSFIRLTYPFVPFQHYDPADQMVLEKVVDGVTTAKATVRVGNSGAQPVNEVSEFRIAVRNRQIAVYRNTAALLSAADASAAPLSIETLTLGARCWFFRITGFDVVDRSGKPVWNDSFAADTTAKYKWNMSPAGGLNALWVWGWYVPAFDTYRFVPGAIGAQLTSFTALQIRKPQNSDPLFYSVSNRRWGGNWVPRMLEEGVTATWGAVTEPYAVFYAPGGNVFDHFWAGYNFGESFYIAENAVRWVMTAFGDPLYAPKVFAHPVSAR